MDNETSILENWSSNKSQKLLNIFDICFIPLKSLLLHNAHTYSLIVDDVDSHSILSDGSDLDGLSRESSSQNSASQTPLDSPGGPRERIKQIQVEAETRRGEFARLLEEHAQVVRKLKMMEAEEQLSATTTTATGNTTVIGGAHAWFYDFITDAGTRVTPRVGTTASTTVVRPTTTASPRFPLVRLDREIPSGRAIVVRRDSQTRRGWCEHYWTFGLLILGCSPDIETFRYTWDTFVGK